MGSSTDVYVTKKVNVYPKIMQTPKILNLSNLDRQCPTLMYMVLFYNKPLINYDKDYIFSSLKGTLEDTLSLWYPAAGRLCRNPSDGKLDLWCNNEGAIMVEARTPIRVSDLGDDLSLYNDFFESLVYKPSCFNGNISEMPLLVVQVTRFGCGGYAVGVGTSHSLFDGQATFNFLSAWDSKLQGTKGFELHKLTHGRDRLMLITPNNSQRNPKNKNHAIVAIQHLYQLITQSASDDHNYNNGSMMMKNNTPQVFVPCIDDHEDCVLHTFHINGLMIDNLKRRIYGLNYSSSSCSSFEAVAAHLWKARTRALGLQRDRMVCLQFSMDTRTRLTPQLPQGFSGNAYVLASIAMSAAELETMSYEAIINKIKAAKNSVDNEYISSYIEALEGSGGALPPLKELTMVSDWTRTPYHKLNLMPHSQAPSLSACPLAPPLPHVAYFMQSAKEDKGMDLRIGLSPQILSSFSHYFLQTLN